MAYEKLTNKQLLFIAEYVRTGNGTKSAIFAGYSEKTADVIASENLTKPKIVQEIDKKMSGIMSKIDIDSEYILGSLKKVAERCMQAEQVVSKDGEPMGEYRFDASGANKSLELLGRNLKLFTDKIEINDSSDITERLTRGRARVLEEGKS